MEEQNHVDPGHRLPDADWAEVVKRAEALAAEQEATKAGGASPVAGPIVDMRGRSGKNSGPSLTTQLLVLHSAECPLAPGYAQSLTEWAITSSVEASWHRFIGPDARVYMMADDLRAWHASEANPMSIGWEQAGYARYSRADWTTPAGLVQMDSLAFDMAQVAMARGIPAVWLETDQVTAVTTYGDRSTRGFCLHRQIDPETRTDPGDGYPYDLLMDRIRGFMGLLTITEDADMTDEQFNLLVTKLDAVIGTSHRAAQVANAIEDDGIRARTKVVRFVRSAKDGSIYEIQGGVLRGVTALEYKLLGSPAYVEAAQADLDAMPKAGK